jgi:hypothetical protein
MSAYDKIFINHPHAVGESYGEHLLFAFRFSFRLLRASLAAFAHGLVPALCETTASSAVVTLNSEIVARRNLMAQTPQSLQSPTAAANGDRKTEATTE